RTSTTWLFFFSSRRRHTRFSRDWSSDVCSSDLWSARVSVNYIEAEYSAGDWDDNFLPGVARNNHYGQVRWQPLLNEHLTLSLAEIGRASCREIVWISVDGGAL